MADFEFIATCSFGLEATLSREMKEQELDNVRSDNGQVAFSGDFHSMARANLWLRTADRVWLKLGKFPVREFEDLFQGVRALPWATLMPANARFPVEGLSHNSQLSSVPACQAVTKKAIVEAMSAHYGLSWFPEDGPLFPIRVSIVKDEATLLLDTSGVGLHKRGYRLSTNEAPLRETLAAGMVLLSYWNAGRHLLDPFCGSGTILIEAAMIGLNRAPGWKREFASQHWPIVGSEVWSEALEECEDMFDRKSTLQLLGRDSDVQSIRLAGKNLGRAGLEGRGIHFETFPFQQLRTSIPYGVIITNPPYGERMSERAEIEKLYREFGQVVGPLLDTWSLYVITNQSDFPRLFGRSESRRRKLYNGLLECGYFQYLGPRPPAKESA